MSSTQLALTWHGPFGLIQIVRDKASDPTFRGHGVYVWFDRARQCVCYVGKADTKTLWERQFSWYFAGIAGHSLIPSAESGRYLWTPSSSDRDVIDRITNEDSYVVLVHQAFSYMANYDVYIAPIYGQPKSVIRDVERALLHRLKPTDTRYPATMPLTDLTLVSEPYPWNAVSAASSNEVVMGAA